MKSLTAFNLSKWIDDNRDLLRPPVCNQQVFDGEDFIVMIVGGPNSRKDFHYNEGPELFYQIEGDMLLQTLQDGRRVDIPIREGDVMLLPPKVPHSVQRFADTVGLVLERKRQPDELDGFMWYCDECNHKLYEEFLYISDIVDQLPPIFERFFGSEGNRACDNCGALMPLPDA